MSKNGDKYGNLREAYCAHYRFPVHQFERCLVWRCFPFYVIPFAMVFWVIERSLFEKDLEAARNAGNATTPEELEGAIHEFENLRGVERGFRRGKLGICIRGILVGEHLEPFLPFLRAKAAASIDLPAYAVPVELRDSGAITIRRIRKIRDDIVQGRSMESALNDTGMTAQELREHLSIHSSGRVDLVWFAEYLAQLDEVIKLRQEAKRLTLVAAELSARLVEFETNANKSPSGLNEERLPI